MSVPPRDGCYEGTFEHYWKDIVITCFCEDHCAWERCHLIEPPEKCVIGTQNDWWWDDKQGYWTAQRLPGIVYIARKYNHFGKYS